MRVNNLFCAFENVLMLKFEIHLYPEAEAAVNGKDAEKLRSMMFAFDEI